MRSSRNPFPLLALLTFTAALGLLAVWVSLRRAERPPDVMYTVTPDPASGRVRVRLDLRGLAPGRVFFLAPETDPSPTGGPPAVPDFGDRDGEWMGPRLWWGEADLRGRLSLSYEVAPRAGDGRHALLAGSRTFAIPLRSDARAALFERGRPGWPGGGHVHGAARRIRVRFELPPGWDAYTPWGTAAPQVEVPGGRFARLRESMVALGDYLPHELEVAGARVLLVTRGTDPLREERLVDLVGDCLAAHAAAVGPSPYPELLVIADFRFRGDQAAGETALNAACLDLSRDPETAGARSLRRVVAHELFHLWNGGASDLDAPELRWFAEGATEYFALCGLAAAGRLSAGALADELGGYLDRLRGNPWADSSFAALGRAYPDEPLAWTATYAKGALSCWALDLRLETAGGLARVVRETVAGGRRPALDAMLAAAGGGTAAGLLDSLSGPRFERALTQELEARGMRLVRTASQELTLGFRSFRPGTTEVLDVDPLGPAAAQGVQSGDRVLRVQGREVDDLAVLSEALADAAGGAVELRLERRGETHDVKLTPARALVTRVRGGAAALAARVPPPGGLAP